MDFPSRLGFISTWGLPEKVLDDLRVLMTKGHSEAEVVAAFIYALSESAVGATLDRAVKRQILKGWKQASPLPALNAMVFEALVGISPIDWNWTSISSSVEAAICTTSSIE